MNELGQRLRAKLVPIDTTVIERRGTGAARRYVADVGTGLTTDQVDHFTQHGWVAPVRVMSVDAAHELRERLEREEQRLGGPLRGAMLQKPHLVYSSGSRCASSPRRWPSWSVIATRR